MLFTSPAANLCSAIIAGATALLVVSDSRAWRAGIWVFKPIASLAFVALAWTLGIDSASDRWLFAALCACAVADVLLIPKDQRTFLAGVGVFGLGHVCFAVAFALRGVQLQSALLCIVPLTVLALQIYRWLAPGVPAELKGPVVAYCAIITLMVAVAFGAAIATADPRIALGAIMFFSSDLSVARDKFIAPAFTNRAWGLPLYYLAQIILAALAAPGA